MSFTIPSRSPDVLPRESFNSLSRDHWGHGEGMVISARADLSTPSLGITKDERDNATLKINFKLSTPSLGITRLRREGANLSELSTPSLGITDPIGVVAKNTSEPSK
jgi:hypothetical protein